MLDFELLREEIGTKVKRSRKNAQYTQQELAGKIEKSRFWLTAIETGNNLPTIEGLYQLADILNCTIFDFLPARIPQKTVSVTGPADVINDLDREQIFSVLDRAKY